MPEQIKRVVAEYFAGIRAMDPDRWIASFAEDAVLSDSDREQYIGREALHRYLREITTNVEQIGLYEDAVFVARNGAAVKWSGRAIGRDGRSVTFEGIDVLGINEAGEIQAVTAYWNPSTVLAELHGLHGHVMAPPDGEGIA